MTNDPTRPTSTVETVRAEERALITTVRVPAERVTLQRRIVTETRTVEVTVRREELVVHRTALPDGTPEQPPGQALQQPLVIVLREEVPVVQLAVQPYERVTAVVELVSGQQMVSAGLRKEHVQIETGGRAGRPTQG